MLFACDESITMNARASASLRQRNPSPLLCTHLTTPVSWRGTTLLTPLMASLSQARVDEIELKIRTMEAEGTYPMPMRVVASSKTGQWLKIDSYKEFPEPITGMAMYFCTLDNADRCYLEPYTISSAVEIKRATARRIGTT
jgi:hypothetical protein